MSRRKELSRIINEIPGLAGVYFQSPASVRMDYPCIRYNFSGLVHRHADNMRYSKFERYTLVLIDKNPDSELPDEILSRFKYCTLDRVYTASNLNHWVFTLFF